jgi:hypothetical protein
MCSLLHQFPFLSTRKDWKPNTFNVSPGKTIYTLLILQPYETISRHYGSNGPAGILQGYKGSRAKGY